MKDLSVRPRYGLSPSTSRSRSVASCCFSPARHEDSRWVLVLPSTVASSDGGPGQPDQLMPAVLLAVEEALPVSSPTSSSLLSAQSGLPATETDACGDNRKCWHFTFSGGPRSVPSGLFPTALPFLFLLPFCRRVVLEACFLRLSAQLAP